jgi:hypothetical protein
MGFPIITTGNFSHGSANTANFTYVSGGGSVSAAAYNSSSYNNATATITINWGTSSRTFTGNYTNQTNHTYLDTGTVNKTGAAGARTTPVGKMFYNFVINKTGNVKDTLASGDSLRCTNLTISGGGMYQYANSILRISGNYSRTSADTNMMLGTKFIAGDMTLGASAGPNKGGDTTLTIFDGAGNSIATLNSAKIGRVRLIKSASTATLTFADPCTTKTLLDSTGTVITSSYHRFDSLAIFADSLVTTSGDSIVTNKLVWSTTVKPNLAASSRFYFDGTRKDTLWSNSAKSIGNVSVNKSGDTLTQVGVAHYRTLIVDDGGFRMNDTAHCDTLIWNSTDPSTLSSVIVVAHSITVAAGASITYSGVGKIISLVCTAATLNGNPVRIYYPTISPISYAASPWVDTIGKTATHAITITGCSLGKDSITNITAFPTGYSINKTTGLISWNGIGSKQSAASYTIRAYANAKTDSASVSVSITIYQPSGKKRKSKLMYIIY